MHVGTANTTAGRPRSPSTSPSTAAPGAAITPQATEQNPASARRETGRGRASNATGGRTGATGTVTVHQPGQNGLPAAGGGFGWAIG